MSDDSLTPEDAELWGTITAFQYILENLYSLAISGMPDPADAARRTGAEMMRQFEDLPLRNADEVPGDAAYVIRQHGLHRLERFWRNVEGRIVSVDRQRRR